MADTSKEKYIGNSQLWDKPKKGFSFKIAPGAVKTEHLADECVTPEKIDDRTIMLAGAFFQNLVFLEYDPETGDIWAYYGKEGNIKAVNMDAEGFVDLYASFAIGAVEEGAVDYLSLVSAGEAISDIEYEDIVSND